MSCNESVQQLGLQTSPGTTVTNWSVNMTLVFGASIFTSIEDRGCFKIRMKDTDE